MKAILISVVIAILMIFASVFIFGSGNSKPTATDTPPEQNVTIADNEQTIELRAKGGYFPRVSIAKAGIPTVLRVNTSGTYDCSASIRIPSLSISKMLPSNGTTDLALGTPVAGTLRGTCGMGMYNFEIQFQ